MTASTPTKYGLFGKLKAKNGKGEELAAILLEAAALIATAKGCHIYIVSKDTQDESCIWVTEVWDNKEDHDNSLKIAGCRELIAQAIPLLDGQPEKGLELEVLGGTGVLMT